MLIIVKVPELVSPDLYSALDVFLTEKSKELKCKIVQQIHKGSRVNIKFADIYDYPYDWSGFIKKINSILELDKH